MAEISVATRSPIRADPYTEPRSKYSTDRYPIMVESDEEYPIRKSDSEEELPLAVAPTYKTSPWRWYVLATFSILSFSNGLNWLTYSSIVKFAAEFYQVSITDTNYLTIIFFIGSVIGAPFAMFVLDTLSLREAVWIGGIINFLGTILRMVSGLTPTPPLYLGFGIALMSQFVIAIAQPYFLFAPPKVAAVWFADGERVIANTICSLSNVIGIGVSMLLAPGIVDQPWKVSTLLEVTVVPALIGLSMAVLGVCQKRPSTPPSPSSEEGMKMWPGLKVLVKNWQFWFLCLVWSIAAGIFNALLTLIPQFLCPYGYTEWFGGIVGASMIFAGLVGALIFGIIVDITKRFEEVSKIVLAITILASIVVMEVYNLPNQPYLIAFAYILFGFFALILMPVFSELAIEITYPVAEGTCNGILWTSVQFVGAGVTFVAPFMTRPVNPIYRDISQCAVGNSTSVADSEGLDYMYLFYTNGFVLFITFVIFTFAFKPKYKRVEAEKKKREEAKKEAVSTN